jgi:hypothetical protein
MDASHPSVRHIQFSLVRSCPAIELVEQKMRNPSRVGAIPPEIPVVDAQRDCTARPVAGLAVVSFSDSLPTSQLPWSKCSDEQLPRILL